MANLAGWPYWKVISITGQAGSGTDYQVELEIGDSAGGDFHLEGHCTNFPQDIRITDDDGTTLLDHWVEDLTADPIVVHVEVKDDLGSNQEIRVYYGKNGETTASNGVNTFITFDDFEGAIIDTSIWDVTATAAISTNQAFQGSQSARFQSTSLVKSLTHGTNYAVKYWAYIVDGDYMYMGLHGVATKAAYPKMQGANADIGYYTNAFQDSGTDATKNTWKPFEFYDYNWSANTFDMIYDGIKIVNDANMRTHSGYDDRFSLLAGAADVYIDCFIVRKYNDPEPAFSSAGAEQTPTVTGHPWFYRRNQ